MASFVVVACVGLVQKELAEAVTEDCAAAHLEAKWIDPVMEIHYGTRRFAGATGRRLQTRDHELLWRRQERATTIVHVEDRYVHRNTLLPPRHRHQDQKEPGYEDDWAILDR